MKYTAAIILTLMSYVLIAQLDTDNNYTGAWSDAGSWDEGATTTTPTTNGSGEVNNQDDFNINGYITETGTLHFANLGNNSYVLTINDTLVVGGDLIFENNAISLTIAANGLLVVFGNYTSANKVDVNNGGTMVVKGNLTMTGGQADYVDGGGGLYVDGTISGNASGPAEAVDVPISDLDGTANSDEQDLFDFVEGGDPNVPLPIDLIFLEAIDEEDHVVLSWASASEINNDFYTVERSFDGITFDVIAELLGAGNSNERIDYSFPDFPKVPGLIYYRLTQTDYDGQFETFPIVNVNFAGSSAGRVEVFPTNVVRGDQLTLSYTSGSIPEIDLQFVDLSGKSAKKASVIVSGNQIIIPTNSLTFENGLIFLKGIVNGLPISQKLLFSR